MSLLSLDAENIEADVQRQLRNPRPDSGTDFRTWAALSAGAKGVPAAGLEVGGSALDFLAPAAIESARHKRPAVLADQPDDSERRKRDLEFVAKGGPVMRAKAAEFTPDPTTSTTADNVLYGLGRIGTKAALAVTAAGPIGGGALLAGEETNTQYRALVDKGIDPTTAMKVAAVEGITAGASVAVPMVGPTVKATLGLAAASGPGAYVAQEALAKSILAKAGYHDEASLHNPTDPTGLAIATLLPAIFGGAHIIGLNRAKPQPIGPIPKESDLKAAAALSPVEQQVSDAFERSAANLTELRKAMAAEKNPQNKAILQAELDKQTEAATKAVGDHVAGRAGVDPDAVDAARVRVTNDALNRSMPEHPEAHAEVLRASDDIAAGEIPNVRSFARLEEAARNDFVIREDARAATMPPLEAVAEARALVGPERFAELTAKDPLRETAIARNIVEFHDRPIAEAPPRSEGTNVLPHPRSVELAAPAAARAERVQTPEAQRVAKMAEETPHFTVKLPGSDETLSVAVAHERAQVEHKFDKSEGDLVKAALDCVLGYGA